MKDIWQDASRPPEERAEHLCRCMTLPLQGGCLFPVRVMGANSTCIVTAKRKRSPEDLSVSTCAMDFRYSGGCVGIEFRDSGALLFHNRTTL